jgi:hypothetical protein
LRVRKWFEGGKELQVARIEGLPETIEKQSTRPIAPQNHSLRL